MLHYESFEIFKFKTTNYEYATGPNCKRVSELLCLLDVTNSAGFKKYSAVQKHIIADTRQEHSTIVICQYEFVWQRLSGSLQYLNSSMRINSVLREPKWSV